MLEAGSGQDSLITAQVALFYVDPAQNNLRAAFTENNGTLGLPQANVIHGEGSLEDRAAAAIDEILGFYSPDNSPQPWYVNSQGVPGSLTLGCAAVFNLVNVNWNEASTRSLERVTSKSLGVNQIEANIVAAGLASLRKKADWDLVLCKPGSDYAQEALSILQGFLPGDEFILSELRSAIEAVRGDSLEPRNFHRDVLGSIGLIPVEGKRRRKTGTRLGRPAQVYKHVSFS